MQRTANENAAQVHAGSVKRSNQPKEEPMMGSCPKVNTSNSKPNARLIGQLKG